MIPDLIAAVLQLPLPVRLALLDAEPTGAGWMAYPEPDGIEPSADLYQRQRDDSSRRIVDGGAAFLPCNPLAIVRHAVAMNRKRLFETTVLDKVPDQLRVRELVREALRLEVTNEESYAAAIALLREVIGG